MKKVPTSIKNKLQSYVNYSQKAEKVRLEIEEWFLKNGIDTDVDSGDMAGKNITDIIIDTGMNGDAEEAIVLMENELNDI